MTGSHQGAFARFGREPEPDIPLSPGQERLWFAHQLDPDATEYNSPVVLRLQGPLNLRRLRDAVDAVVLDHPMLRATVPERDGEPVLRVHRQVPTLLEERAASPAGTVAELTPELRRLGLRPFRLKTERPVRAVLWRLTDDEAALALVMHHMVVDGASIRLLVRDLGRAYAAGRVPGVPAPVAPFAAYAAAERAAAGSPEVLAEVNRRADLLAGIPGPKLPGRSTVRATGPRAGRYRVTAFPAERAAAVRAAAERHGMTAFMLLLAALEAEVARQSGQDRFLVALPVSRRRRAQADLVGFFVDTDVLVADVRATRPEDRYAQVRTEVLRAAGGPAVPLDLLVRRIRGLGVRDWTGRLRLVANSQRGHERVLRWGDLTVTRFLELGFAVPAFDLQVGWWESRASTGMTVLYEPAVHPPATVDRLAAGVLDQLTAMVAGPGGGRAP